VQRNCLPPGQVKKLMRAKITSIIWIAIISLGACKREQQVNTSECHSEIYPFCPTSEPTVFKLENEAAIVIENSGSYFLVQPNTIDTRLLPCNLDPAFRVHGLPVIISGVIKRTSVDPNAPCCVESFIISCIRKR